MTDISRRSALRVGAVGLAGVVGCAGCAAPTDREPLLREGFEDGRSEWDAAAAIGPEVAVEDFEWAVERSREQAATGEWSLRVFTEGDHDDGTAWATHRVAVPPGTTAFRVELDAWSQSESFNTLRHLVAALRPSRPESEADFPDPGQNSTGIADAPYGGLREPLHQSAGWREYAFEWRPDSVPETLFCSVGVSVVWEAAAVHYLDDVRVTALD